MKQKARFLVSASFLMVVLTGNVIGQKEDRIKAILKASDVKKIEKVDANKEVADKLMEEANELYKETVAVKGSTQLDEKERMKKVRELERQTRQKIKEASDLYRERNGTKYTLYKTYIEEFWLQFAGNEASFENAKKIEEESNDLYYQAVVIRTEANKLPDGHEKIQKLNLAIESENLAIDKQVTVLGLYYDIDLAEKEAVIELPVESVFLTETVLLAEVEVQTLSAAPEKEPEITSTESPVAETLSEPKPQSTEGQIVAVGVVAQPQQTPSEVEFRIQLAASRTPLSREKVAMLCSKTYRVDMAEENGWYKYHIVAGNSYEEAKNILSECGADKAFITPYKNGQRITLSEATQKANP